MSIQYILGNSGSGKTFYLYEEVRRMAKENPSETFYIVVPEQYTMQTQRDFVLGSERDCIINIDVVSFDRLAYRIFDELGMQQIEVLDDMGKNLLLQKIIQECKDQLKIFTRNVEKPGYIDQIKSLISEFEQYQIETSTLNERVNFTSNPVLYTKIEDLSLIFDQFRNYLSEQLITNEELLHVFALNITRSSKLRNATFVFEGYTGFTPVQEKVVEELAKVGKNLLFTILIDSKDDFRKVGEKHHLFYMSRKYIKQLHEIGERTHCMLEDPIILSGENGRYSHNEELRFLEQNIFRNKSVKYAKELNKIQILQFKDPKEETEYIAAMIEKLVRENQGRYQDYAVVTGDIETYGELMKAALSNLSIPFYIDEKKKLSFSAGMEFVKSAIEIVTTNYSYESVFRLLKTGFFDWERKKIDELENFCIKYRIFSGAKWKKSWLEYSKTESETEYFEEMRTGFMEIVEPFVNHMTQKNQSVRDKTIQLYDFLVQMQLEKKLEEFAEDFLSKGLFVKEKEYRQSYRKIIEILERMVELLGREQLSNEDFSQVLNAAFDTTKIGTIPAGNDFVLVGDVSRSRFEKIETLFFVGLNDGIVPKATIGSLCFSQQEREELEQRGIVLAPSATERMYMQQFYLYMVFTKPTKQLICSYPMIGLSGTSMMPSHIISQIKKLFPDLKIRIPSIYSGTKMLFTQRQAFHILAVCLGEEGNHNENALSKNLLQWFLSQDQWADASGKLLKSLNYRYVEEKLNKELSNALYGNVLFNSVSRLESFEKCPCMHFLKYGLRIKERETGDFKQIDLGNALHEALERFGSLSKEMNSAYTSLSRDEQEMLVDQLVNTTLSGMNAEYLLENPRKEYDIRRMKRLVDRTVRTIAREMEESNFVPSYFEVPFERIRQVIVDDSLDGQNQISMTGKIDRIDLIEQEKQIDYRVIDYKSGTHKLDYSSVYYGLQMQLAVYAHFAQQLLMDQYPEKKVIPNGIYYYKIDDPLIAIKDQISDADLEDKIAKELALTGESNEEIIEVLKKHTLRTIYQSQKKIQDGEIQVHPILHGTESGCDYCDYSGICKFDPKLEGFSYRQLKKLESDEAVQKMKEE